MTKLDHLRSHDLNAAIVFNIQGPLYNYLTIVIYIVIFVFAAMF